MLRNDFQEMILKHFGSLIVKEKNNEIVFDKFLFENYGVIITKDVKEEISNLEEIFKKVYKNDNIDKTLFSLNQIFNLSEEEKAYHTVMHYFTTYGKELLQLIVNDKFKCDFIYIPRNLDVNSKPMLTKASEDSVAVRLVIGITLDDLKEKIFKIFDVDTGLNKDFIIDMAYLIKNLFKEDFIELVKKDAKVINREFFSACLSACDIIPKNPELFIKAVLAKENKIMIRNNATFETLMTKSEKLKEYLDLYGYKEISKNWHRLRKYFLVMKKNLPKEYKKMINRARKEAKKLNIPFKLSPVNNVLMIKPDLKIFTNAIKKINIYQLVKVYNYLNFYLNSCASHSLYKIRNGKIWIKERLRMDETTRIKEYLSVIEQEIIDRQMFKDKVFYIPSNIQYTFPTSSKQTIGGIPYGSQIIFDSSNIAVGIQWNNNDKYGRVDLDLHYRNIDGVSVSWDTQYTLNYDIYFTGDVTDAKNGACELMLVKIPTAIKSILAANYFNCPSNYQDDLKYNFIVIDSNKKFNDIDMKEVYDPMEVGNILINKELTMIGNNMILGLMTGKRFIFGSYSIGYVRTSNLKININELLIQTIYDSTEYSMAFDKFIELSGGKVIRNIDENVSNKEYKKLENGNYAIAMVKEVDKQKQLDRNDIIDLSLQNISSNTFFDLIG